MGVGGVSDSGLGFWGGPSAGACGVPARTVGVARVQASKSVGVTLRPLGSPGCPRWGVAGADGPGRSAGELGLGPGPGPSPSEELGTLWRPNAAPRAASRSGRVSPPPLGGPQPFLLKPRSLGPLASYFFGTLSFRSVF